MNIREGISAIRALDREIDARIDMALAAGLGKAKDAAVEMSSGPYSTARLRKMDHPYARRHGSPNLPAEIINAQSGMFRSRWQAQILSSSFGSAVGRISNDSPVAEFLVKGNDKMFARPIDQAAADKTEFHVCEQLSEAVRELERKHG